MNMTMETGDDKGAIGFVFVVERDAAGEGIGTTGVGYILGHVEIKVEEAGTISAYQTGSCRTSCWIRL